MKMRELRVEYLLRPVLLLSGLSIGLLLARTIATGTAEFWFLNWNLVLAWLPLVFAWFLIRTLQGRRWLSWQALVLTLLWLLFLPNSFYLITDFVHLEPYAGVSLMFDAIMLLSYALTGLMLGYLSVLLVYERMRHRFERQARRGVLAAIFLACSYAIYLGRNLGWNSWDVVYNPAGIMLDTLDRVVYPGQHTDTFTMTILLFIFLSTVYASFYSLTRLFRGDK